MDSKRRRDAQVRAQRKASVPVNLDTQRFLDRFEDSDLGREALLRLQRVRFNPTPQLLAAQSKRKRKQRKGGKRNLRGEVAEIKRKAKITRDRRVFDAAGNVVREEGIGGERRYKEDQEPRLFGSPAPLTLAGLFGGLAGGDFNFDPEIERQRLAIQDRESTEANQLAQARLQLEADQLRINNERLQAQDDITNRRLDQEQQALDDERRRNADEQRIRTEQAGQALELERERLRIESETLRLQDVRQGQAPPAGGEDPRVAAELAGRLAELELGAERERAVADAAAREAALAAQAQNDEIRRLAQELGQAQEAARRPIADPATQQALLRIRDDPESDLRERQRRAGGGASGSVGGRGSGGVGGEGELPEGRGRVDTTSEGSGEGSVGGGSGAGSLDTLDTFDRLATASQRERMRAAGDRAQQQEAEERGIFSGTETGTSSDQPIDEQGEAEREQLNLPPTATQAELEARRQLLEEERRRIAAEQGETGGGGEPPPRPEQPQPRPEQIIDPQPAPAPAPEPERDTDDDDDDEDAESYVTEELEPEFGQQLVQDEIDALREGLGRETTETGVGTGTGTDSPVTTTDTGTDPIDFPSERPPRRDDRDRDRDRDRSRDRRGGGGRRTERSGDLPHEDVRPLPVPRVPDIIPEQPEPRPEEFIPDPIPREEGEPEPEPPTDPTPRLTRLQREFDDLDREANRLARLQGATRFAQEGEEPQEGEERNIKDVRRELEQVRELLKQERARQGLGQETFGEAIALGGQRREEIEGAPVRQTDLTASGRLETSGFDFEAGRRTETEVDELQREAAEILRREVPFESITGAERRRNLDYVDGMEQSVKEQPAGSTEPSGWVLENPTNDPVLDINPGGRVNVVSRRGGVYRLNTGKGSQASTSISDGTLQRNIASGNLRIVRGEARRRPPNLYRNFTRGK